MKKLGCYVGLLCAVLSFVSCNKELETVLRGDTRTIFTVNCGEAVTKADIGDGTNVDFLHWEIYFTDKMEGKCLGESVVAKTADNEFKVDLNLVKNQDYTIIFWAHKAKDPKGTDGLNDYYDVTDLRKISINYMVDQKDLNDEDRAAFFKAHQFTTSAGPVNEDIVLKRPFAQLNFGTSTLQTSLNNVNSGLVQVNKTTVSVKPVAKSFNTVTGYGEDETVLTYTRTVFPSDSLDQKSLEANEEKYYWLSMNYLAIEGGDKDDVKVDFKVNTTVGEINHEIPSVPLYENYRTNIIGDLLTTGSKFSIVVDEKFLQPDNNHTFGNAPTVDEK